MAEQIYSDLLIDTNLVMHFRRLDEIDWPNLTGAVTCTIWIAPILLRELEMHKVHHKLAKLRERAGEMVDYLVTMSAQVDPISLRDRVTLAFIDHEPLIDFTVHRLRPDVADDQLIASALDLAHETGRPNAIVSGDGGLAIKLRARPIGLLRLPDTLKLPSAADARDKEVRDLKQQLAKATARRPLLNTTFPDGSHLLKIGLPTRVVPIPPDLESVRTEHGPYNAGYLERSPGTNRGIQTFSAPSNEQIARYEEARMEFLDKYAAYLDRETQWREIVEHMFALRFLLANKGSGPATNIDVHLNFPEPVTLWKALPDKPSAPQAPIRPQTRLDFIHGPGIALGRPRLPDFPIFHGPINDGDASFEDGERAVTYSVRTLKHRYTEDLAEIVLLVPRHAAKGFEIAVEISCNEIDPVTAKLAVNLE
jgi:hypothetical protein